MKFLRNILEQGGKWVEKGKPLHPFFRLYEAMDVFFFTPNKKTEGTVHVRDINDFKRMMIAVCIALIPCCLMGMYNVGYQANLAIQNAGIPLDKAVSGWHGWILNFLNAYYPMFQADNILSCFVHGAVYFVPLYALTMVVGLFWEILFAHIRGHEVNEGFFVTGLVFPLTLPATIPLWQVAIGISFGVIVGKEVFGGTGRNFLNPALVARAFLFFAYAPSISGDKVWTAVDGFSSATPLSIAMNPVNGGVSGLASNNYGFLQSFFGLIPGSIGETSTFACLIGVVFLLLVGVVSWRIVLSMLVGGMGMATFFMLVGSETNAAWNIGPFWHFVLGGFAFGMVFMATDPVTAALTKTGQLCYGFMIGLLIIIVRVLNPAYPEGTMLVILLGNCCAPLIDYYVVKANIARRKKRLQASDSKTAS